jgi:hypothetical protein
VPARILGFGVIICSRLRYDGGVSDVVYFAAILVATEG